MKESRPLKDVLSPHPALWAALEEGKRLRTILQVFYERVYQDPSLAPFFAHTTIEWAIDHQYAFLGQIFSGEQMFFGDRPRNAHHWMVISNELFDYRERLMMQVLEEQGLSKAFRDEWHEVEEAFRSHIVKDKAWPKKRAGVALPIKGFESIELSAGGMCDACEVIIDVGAKVDYHLRTGRVYCGACIADARAKDTLRPPPPPPADS